MVDRRKIDAFELWYWRRIPWTARKTNKKVIQNSASPNPQILREHSEKKGQLGATNSPGSGRRYQLSLEVGLLHAGLIKLGHPLT